MDPSLVSRCIKGGISHKVTAYCNVPTYLLLILTLTLAPLICGGLFRQFDGIITQMPPTRPTCLVVHIHHLVEYFHRCFDSYVIMYVHMHTTLHVFSVVYAHYMWPCGRSRDQRSCSFIATKWVPRWWTTF